MSHVVDVPHHSERVAEPSGLMTRVWWSALDRLARAVRHHVPLTGTATFAAANSVAVVFASAESSTDYNIHIEQAGGLLFWHADKATTGFTINASAVNSDTVGWSVVRR